MSVLKEALSLVRQARRIAIAGHINPDGDALGSLLSLGLGLESQGKEVYLIRQGRIPLRYRSLPGASRMVSKLPGSVDLAISVDCNSEAMLGGSRAVFHKAKKVLAIDHHELRKPFGDCSLVDTRAAAVGELVFVLLKGLGVKISQDIARNILTSIIVETNSFRLPATRAFTFEICAYLLKRGVDYYALSDMVYWSRSRQELWLSKACLERSVFINQGRIAWSIARKSDFKKIRGVDADLDALADEMRAIKGVRIAVLFRQKTKKLLRVSIRSKTGINVAFLAERFGGGGHADVAGCFIPYSRQAMNGLLREASLLID